MNFLKMSNLEYAKALIRAGIAKDLVLKITSISTYQYSRLEKNLQSSASADV